MLETHQSRHHLRHANRAWGSRCESRPCPLLCRTAGISPCHQQRTGGEYGASGKTEVANGRKTRQDIVMRTSKHAYIWYLDVGECSTLRTCPEIVSDLSSLLARRPASRQTLSLSSNRNSGSGDGSPHPACTPAVVSANCSRGCATVAAWDISTTARICHGARILLPLGVISPCGTWAVGGGWHKKKTSTKKKYATRRLPGLTRQGGKRTLQRPKTRLQVLLNFLLPYTAPSPVRSPSPPHLLLCLQRPLQATCLPWCMHCKYLRIAGAHPRLASHSPC